MSALTHLRTLAADVDRNEWLILAFGVGCLVYYAAGGVA